MEFVRTHLRNPYLPWIAGGVVLFLVFLGIGAFAAQKLAGPRPQIPQSVAGKMKFPVYLPQKLPGTYQIEQDSFAIRESTILFGIRNKEGSTMAFSEQAKTANLDFPSIYKQQFKSSQKLNGTPYPSFIGKTNDEKMHLLSIETPETWILISASTTNEQELLEIAKHISKQ